MKRSFLAIVAAATTLTSSAALAQAPVPPVAAATQQAAPPPATKLEAFHPSAGAVTTLAYNELGKVGRVSVDAREFRAGTSGAAVRGMVVDVTQSEYRSEKAMVDADELPELLKGLDALMAVKANPTKFQQFEVRYTTKGDLQITAFNASNNEIHYAIQAGRITHASAYVNANEILQFRALVVLAQTTLAETK